MSFKFNFKFSQCIDLLNETTTTTADIPSARHTKNKNKALKRDKTQEQQQQIVRPMDDLEKSLHDMHIYEEKLSSFCGLWEDYPYRYYRMDFRIEMGQLVGYSNIDNRKALASYDGKLINMIIIHSKESGHPLDHYRGCLGWNKKYIRWEKEDVRREGAWRPTRRWIKIE